MTSARLLCLLTLGFVLGGCPPPPGPTDGGDDGGADGGVVAPDGGDAIGDLGQGAPCLVGNDLCAADLICSRVFETPAAVGARCWPRCEVAGACVGAGGATGDCRTSVDGAGVCVVMSPMLGPCGDAAAAVCADGQLCAFVAEALRGTCVTPCSPGDPSTCAQELEDVDCGCDVALDCSVEGIRLAAPDEGEADGVCVPPTMVGDGCGVDEDGVRTQCSPGQRCEAADGGLGLCVAAP